MFKVTVMTDGYMKHPVDAILQERAKAAGGDCRTLLNGVSVTFEREADAETFHEVVLDHPKLKGKLANLSIGAA